MPLAPLRRTFAAAACLLLTLYAWDAADASLRPDSSSVADTFDAVAEAQALIDAGRFMEAVGILGPLVAEDTIEANTLFLYGLAATGASQQAGVPDETRDALLDQAIASFHAMLVRAPGLVRVRLELARAFYLKGEDGLAQHHFERVLAGNPPDAVADNVRRFLDEIRGAGAVELQCRLRGGAGHQHWRHVRRAHHHHLRSAVRAGRTGTHQVGHRPVVLGRGGAPDAGL